jgi:hypothetical protein
MNQLSVAEMRDLEKQVSVGEISYSRMVEIINQRFDNLTTENARLREALEAETKKTKKLTKGISLCLAAINGGLDGLELDNTCDVTENSFIIQQLKDQSEILTQALTENLTNK